MIISDRPGKFTCPHCGGEKYVLAIFSGNTCRGEVWSDSRHYYPMMPQYSPIQKCPECGRYFFKEDGDFKMVDSVTVDGKPLDDNALYGVATNSFLLDGGDGFFLEKNAEEKIVCTGYVYDGVLQYVRKLTAAGRSIEYHLDERIVILQEGDNE